MTNHRAAFAVVTGPGMTKPAVAFVPETKSTILQITRVLVQRGSTGMTIRIAASALKTRSGMTQPTVVSAQETRSLTSTPTAASAPQTRSGITQPTAVCVPRDWCTMRSTTTAPAPPASTTMQKPMRASVPTTRSSTMASVSAPSRAKCTMMDMAVAVLVTKWSVMVNACVITAPTVTMLWSTGIRASASALNALKVTNLLILTTSAFASVPRPASMVTPSMRRRVHVSMMSLSAHVWHSAAAFGLLLVVPGRTLNTGATTPLVTASGHAIIKHHLTLLFTSWNNFKSIF